LRNGHLVTVSGSAEETKFDHDDENLTPFIPDGYREACEIFHQRLHKLGSGRPEGNLIEDLKLTDLWFQARVLFEFVPVDVPIEPVVSHSGRMVHAPAISPKT
jgi:hypothetical protein